jgi:hypothetical protein
MFNKEIRMNADFYISQKTAKDSSKSESEHWLLAQEDWDLKRFLSVTVVSLGIGAAVGTTLAVVLDLPPALGVCQAIHSLRK